MNWDDMKYFLAIARAQSLSEAGRQLKVSQPTVSRRLAAMEARFGVSLFDRTGKGYELSVTGAEIYETAQHVEQELNSIDRRVMGHDGRLGGSLRITCTEVMANLYLTPHIKTFLQANPAIDLSIVCTFDHLSLSRREADVALRVTRKPPDTLIGRRLVKAAMAVYGAATPISNQRPRPKPADLDWIGWQDEAFNRAFIDQHFPKARIRHRVDDMQTMKSMAGAGLGVAVLPCYMADRDPTLRRVLDSPLTESAVDLWLLMHPDVRRMARVRIFADFITKTILADRDLFEGRMMGAGQEAASPP